MIAGLALAAALAASPAASPIAVGTGLDCAAGYDALAARIAALPNLQTYAGDDPLLSTWTDKLTLWAATRPGHPAHPAIVKRVIQQDAKTWVDTSACGYGDRPAFDAMMQHFEQRNAALVASYR